MKKRQRAKKVIKVDEFGIGDSLSLEAKVVLQNLATEFVQSCFNRKTVFSTQTLIDFFSGSLLKSLPFESFKGYSIGATKYYREG